MIQRAHESFVLGCWIAAACKRTARLFSIAAVCWTALAASPVAAQEVPGGCGFLGNAFGPFDYRAERYKYEDTFKSHAAQLRIVEINHFTPEVEALLRGKSGLIGEDLGYTLRAYPNHHRALIAMGALGKKEKTDKPSGSIYTVECWLRRAVAWRSDDNIVRLIYANFLAERNRHQEADQQLQVAAAQAGDNAFTLHNIGLIYFDMGNYDKALRFAHMAYSLGLGNPLLMDQLKKAGKWVEASVEATPKAAADQPR